MYFDWKTWGIELIGFLILIIWILVPVREFKNLLQKKRKEMKNSKR